MESRNWLKYYIPLCWTFTTRYPSLMNRISFFIIDAFPSLYLVLLINGFELRNAASWLVAFLVTFCLYECGYIFNEIVCVKYEKDPTIRIEKPYWNDIPRHMENLLTIRVLLAIIGSWWLILQYPDHYTAYLLCIMGLLGIYSIHNFYRGKINILTMAGDVSFKYLTPIVLFATLPELGLAYLDVFLSIILVRSLEYVSKKRYVKGFDAIRDVDTFRIKYYIVINVLAAALWLIGLWDWWYCGLPMIFLCYRIATYLLIHRSSAVASKINSNRERHGTLRK